MDEHAIIKVLARFESFNDEQKESILKSFKEHHYPKAKVILREGFANRHIYFLKEGIVKQSIYTITGSQKTLSFLVSGDFFTDLESFEKRKASNVTYTTEVDCVVYSIDFFCLQQLIDKYHAVRSAFAKLKEYHLDLKLQRQELITKQPLEYRIIKTLEEYPEVIKNCKKRDIISYLRTNSQTYNFILKNLTVECNN